MAYHQASSPSYSYDHYSPVVSPSASGQDSQGQHTHTPKRRRMNSDYSGDFDSTGLPFMPPDDVFDFAGSPSADFGQRSPPPSIPQFNQGSSSNWEFEVRWEDMPSFAVPPPTNSTNVNSRLQQAMSREAPTRPQFTDYLHHASDPQRSYRQGFDYPDYHSWQLSRMASPPSLIPYIRPPPPRVPNTQAQDLPRVSFPPSLPSHGSGLISLPLQRHHPVSAQPTHPPAVLLPPSSVRRKGAIILTLSRANKENIEALPEHKRECPACQLEFEPDNYLAVISCCGTAMHAVCFSAWVNSQTYAKTKVCMKCRKSIDARRSLNSIVPAVTDKSWDEGVEFDAPASVNADTKMEVDVSGRNEAMYRRYANMRRDPSYYRRRVPLISENEIPAESRAAFQELQREVRRESEEIRVRYKDIRQAWRNALDQEARIAQSLVDAKDALQEGLGMTQREVEGLGERLREAREAQEHAHNMYRSVSKELDETDRRHQGRQVAFLEQTLRR